MHCVTVRYSLATNNFLIKVTKYLFVYTFCEQLTFHSFILVSMEFHPVILSGGQGTKLYPLVEQSPKALLSIANKPIIWYVIEFLHKYGFEEAIIVSKPPFFDKIKACVETFISVYNIPIKLACYCLPIDKHSEMGTADALRFIQPHIKSDLLIIPCDILIDIPLQQFANIHRCYNSALTVLLTTQKQASPSEQSAGAMKTYKAGRDVIALAEGTGPYLDATA